jgi:hypothetical protein
LVVEEILSETFGRTKLQLVEGGADVGEAQEVGSLQFSVFSFQRERRRRTFEFEPERSGDGRRQI